MAEGAHKLDSADETTMTPVEFQTYFLGGFTEEHIEVHLAALESRITPESLENWHALRNNPDESTLYQVLANLARLSDDEMKFLLRHPEVSTGIHYLRDQLTMLDGLLGEERYAKLCKEVDEEKAISEVLQNQGLLPAANLQILPTRPTLPRIPQLLREVDNNYDETDQ